MYLISIYFDESSSIQLQKLITDVAAKTGNSFMLDNHVPPHITIAAVETKQEDKLIACIDRLVTTKLKADGIQWVSVGAFMPQVLFVQPVLNKYLHYLSETLSEELKEIGETIISPYYQPFAWLPHCTIAKQLTGEQMLEGYKVLQKQFVPMGGRVIRIGVARTNPHRDIKIWEVGEP